MRTLATVEKCGTIIRHKTVGTVGVIGGVKTLGFNGKVMEGFDVVTSESSYFLPFKDVENWEVMPVLGCDAESDPRNCEGVCTGYQGEGCHFTPASMRVALYEKRVREGRCGEEEPVAQGCGDDCDACQGKCNYYAGLP